MMLKTISLQLFSKSVRHMSKCLPVAHFHITPQISNQPNVPTHSLSNQERSIQTNAKLKPSTDSFRSRDVLIDILPDELRPPKPAWDKLLFGHHCSDHMIEVHWTESGGWDRPKICPVHPFSLHPFSKVFHYAPELFEGMKAYRGVDGKIRLFRPDLNMTRMRLSAQRLCLPDFDGDELLDIIKKLMRVDEAWIPPYETKSTLYIRPTLIGTEETLGVSPSKKATLFVVTGPVGPYFPAGFKPVSLLADPKYVRAWPGGSGDRKLGSNYAPTLAIQMEAIRKGCQQVLWLFGPDHQLTEVGTMNIFVLLQREDGKTELVTPPLTDGLILPGVTRHSLIELVRSWNEFELVERVITMDEVQHLIAHGRLLEMFGAGTACVVSPVGEIHYQGKVLKLPNPTLSKRLYDELTNIQYGVTNHPWSVVV